MGGEQNTEFKEKFVTPTIFEDVVTDLSMIEDLNSIVNSISLL